MANVVYNSFKAKIMDGSIDLDNDTIKVALVTSAYTPNADTHIFWDDVTGITGAEATGTGYTAGGATLGGASVSTDTGDNEGVFDASDVTWASSSISANGAVIYKDTGTASTSPLICYFDFGTTETSASGNFKIQWNGEGILNLG